jgi:hypothetical protein
MAESQGGNRKEMKEFNYVSVTGAAANNRQYSQYGMNGRVDISQESRLNVIPAYTPNRQVAFNQEEALKGQFAKNPLADLYFSQTNINALQDGIRYKIYQATEGRHVIGRQSEQDLRVIMRSIYLQYAKHLSCDFVAQVRELNAKVLEWVVPEVLSNLRQYEIYKRDVSTLPVPMERAPLATQKGTKVLEIKSFF